jgi:purine nucleoside permease
MDYALNPKLAEWAYNTSKGVTLADSDALKAYRAKYTGFPLAQQPPQIIMGDWVQLWTGGQGAFTTTAMEHQDYMNTLTDMSKQGFVDINRVMMLRGASNYCMPPPGQDIESTIGDESVGTLPAFEADYRAATAVAHELLKNWTDYRDTIPRPRS